MFKLVTNSLIHSNSGQMFAGSMLRAVMKQHLITPALALAVGIGIGVTVDRSLVGGGSDESSAESQSSARLSGPRAGQAGLRDGSGNRHTGLSRPANSDPVATIRRLLEDREAVTVQGAQYEWQFKAYEAISRMSPDEIELAMHELAGEGRADSGEYGLRSMLMRRWAEADAEGALTFALSIEAPLDRLMGLKNSLAVWLESDPERAYQWFRDKRDEVGHDELGSASGSLENLVFNSLAISDMKTAFIALKEVKASSRVTALSTIGRRAGRDPEERELFFKELSRLEGGYLKQSGMRSVMGSWVVVDPVGATKYLENMDPKPEKHDDLVLEHSAFK